MRDNINEYACIILCNKICEHIYLCMKKNHPPNRNTYIRSHDSMNKSLVYKNVEEACSGKGFAKS